MHNKSFKYVPALRTSTAALLALVCTPEEPSNTAPTDQSIQAKSEKNTELFKPQVHVYIHFIHIRIHLIMQNIIPEAIQASSTHGF